MIQITKTNMLWIFVLAVIMPISLNAACIEGGRCEGNGDCCKPSTPPSSGTTEAPLPTTPAPKKVPNLALVSWAHAVNSHAELMGAIKNKAIKMIEADVVMGTVMIQPPTEKPETSSQASISKKSDGATGNEKPTENENSSGNQKPPGTESEKPDEKPIEKPKEQIPIMGHPPLDTSDLSFEKFVDIVVGHNAVAKEVDVKGVKLDFKTTDVVKNALPLIKKNELKLSPVWINADILVGPGGSSVTPVDAKAFFDAVKAEKVLNKATLSIGWTTSLVDDAQYTEANVDEMLKTIRDNIKKDEEKLHPITFPVRAAIAAQSQAALDKLVTEVEKMDIETSLTIWSAKEDKEKVDINKLKDLIKHFGTHKVYVDLDDKLKEQVLSSQPNGASSLVNFGLLNVVTFLFALFMRNGLY